MQVRVNASVLIIYLKVCAVQYHLLVLILVLLRCWIEQYHECLQLFGLSAIPGGQTFFLYNISGVAYQGGMFVAAKLSASLEHVGLLTG